MSDNEETKDTQNEATASEETVDSQNRNESEIAALNEEIESLKDQNVRLQAEIQNIQKRQKREIEDSRRFRSQALAEELLPAIDNLEQVLNMEVSTEGEKSIQKGVELIMKNILTAFESEDIEKIDPLGETFDPNFHEAYTTVPADEEHPEGTVTQVFQKGYSLDGRVLRAAKVVVAK